MNHYFLGIDVSTTASKALVIDQEGHVVASHSKEYALKTPYPLWAEQNPDDWWEATSHSIQQVLKKVSPESIASIGLTGQMHGLVSLDKKGKPLRPAILWNDQRSNAECEEITEQLGSDFLIKHIGSILLPCFITPKLLWLKKQEPDVYDAISHILLPKDYVRFCLSGEYATDVSDASGLGLLDIEKRIWSTALLSILKIPHSWLPRLFESQEISATVSAAAAKKTGLKVGTPIAAGAGDQPAQSIGNGIIESGLVSLAVGTSGVTFSIADKYHPDLQGRVNTFCHAIPNKWFHMGVTMSAAGSLRWLRDTLAPTSSYASLDQKAVTISRGSNGLLFAPYLSGERHPHSDAFARATWVGLTLNHQLAHMIRSVLEGVAFSLRDNIELFRILGIHPESVIMSGGGANSELWSMIIAEVMGLPLYTLHSNEGAALGAAILAAVGVKAWPDVPSACCDLIKKNKEILPDPLAVTTYDQIYKIYRELYPNLSKTFHHLTEFDAMKFH